MSPIVILLLGTGLMLLLIVLHVPVGVAMALSGLTLFGALAGAHAALGTVPVEVVSAFSSTNLAVIPLFLLMGSLAARAGLSSDIYQVASAWVGHRRGGLGMATVAGCAGFGALCGSSVATAVTMGRVALPEMLSRGYSPALASGAIAAGGTLGILIPPSIPMVIYAVLTNQFVLDLFVAGILPGLLKVLLYGVAIFIVTRHNPTAGPAFERVPWRERFQVLVSAWRAIVVIAAVVLGLYSGIFTVVEAASIGVAATLVFFLTHCPHETWMSELRGIAVETAQNTAMIFLMVLGAALFSYFLTMTQAPQAVISLVRGAHLNRYMVMGIVLLMYLFLGCVFDSTAAMILTTPFVFPLITGLGFNPIWWGVMMVVMIEVGMITPPVGLNIFVLHGAARHIPLKTIFRGVMAPLMADFVLVGLLIAFPAIALTLLK